MKKILKKVLDKYRHIGIKKGDIFLISCQNSGTFLFRKLFVYSFIGVKPSKENLDNFFPPLGNHNKKTKNIPNTNKRIIKSHYSYRNEYRKKKIIYLIRDPRDIAVANYYRKKQNKNKIKKTNFIEKFSKGKIMSEGRWDNHFKKWFLEKKRGNIDFLLIKYENLKNNSLEEIKKISEFLNLKIIQEPEKNNLIEKNKEQYEINKWKKDLNKNQTKIIEKEFHSIMKKLGYL